MTHSSPLQGSPPLGLCSRDLQEKKHWPDSSPSCGWPSSPQLLSLLPSLAAQLWWKKARAEMLVLVGGFLVGLYPKGSSYSRRFHFFFFQRWKPHPLAPPPFKKFLAKPHSQWCPSSLTRDWTHLHQSPLHWKRRAFIIRLPRKSQGDSSLGLHTTIYTGAHTEYSILE